MKRVLPIVVLALVTDAVLAQSPTAGETAVASQRLKAVATAQRSAPGSAPSLALDEDEGTVWLASGTVAPENNAVWFQLDVGAVKPLARLRWVAAHGTPYPAGPPARYEVLVSTDGKKWRQVASRKDGGATETIGDVLLNTDARYVRMQTRKVNDGTGWALGLKEIWLTEGRVVDVASAPLRLTAASVGGAVRLSWTLPATARPERIALYRSERPGVTSIAPLILLPANARTYRDRIPAWSPRYYWVEARNARGKALMRSPTRAAVARPAHTAARIETFAFWYEPYLPSTSPEPSLRKIGNAPFVVGLGGTAAQDLAKNGKAGVPYITLYQTDFWAPRFAKDSDASQVSSGIASFAFYRRSIRFPDSPRGYVPSLFCRPGNPEYDAQAIQYTACPNSARMRERVLKHVRRELGYGSKGVFIDNGYEDDVASRSVCESPHHAHYYGRDLSAAQAFLGLMLDLLCEVKRRDPGGMVMVNGGVPPGTNFYGLTLRDVCESQLWESYLRTAYSTPAEHRADWESTYKRSVELEKAAGSPPRPMYVLSYPWDRDEAFFCYATAKLCDMPWSAGLGVDDPQHAKFGGHFGTYPELIDVRLGAPLNPKAYGGAKLGSVYYRQYEQGVVVVNPTRATQSVTLPLDGARRYRELYSGHEAEGSSLTLTLPAESGRVCLWR